VAALVALGSGALPAGGQGLRQIITVATRPEVTVRVAVLAPLGPPSGVLLLFPGGSGARQFGEDAGGLRLGTSFLVRSAPLFAARGFLVAIVDAPSDQSGGMSDVFRTSPEHAADVARVLAMLRARTPAPPFLIGTNRGTLSVAFLGYTLSESQVAGIALTASVTATSGLAPFNLSLAQLPLPRITRPVLLVHHRNDRCWTSAYDDVLQVRVRLTRSQKIDFVEVMGGDPPQAGACEALSAHGFLGKEADVVAVITDWALGRPLPLRVGP
jgi:hypothetical protein